MEDNKNNNPGAENTPQDPHGEPVESGIKRRDMLKGLATVPVVGALLYGAYRKEKYENFLKENIHNELGINTDAPAVSPKTTFHQSGEQLRLGIIGYGIRGEQLVRAAGFATPEWKLNMRDAAAKNRNDKRYYDFMQQDDLNIVFNGVCDVFDVRAENALAAVGPQAKRYRNYQEMLASPDIDAVVIATPDHWHAQMAIDAARAGKHVYVEKCLTRTLDEARDVVSTVKATGVTFQLGHQHRQTESHLKAKELIDKGVLGPITLIETTTNRNSPNGAWVYPIHEKASPETIDWEQFLGNAPYKPFNKEHFFRWRCWWDYGTGLGGDLLTHEFDSINQILNLGIPKTAVASGGVYFFKDGREVPDVWQVALEYPDKGVTFLYSASLANQNHRPNLIMGHDATMEIGKNLIVTPDANSTRYKHLIKDGIMDLSLPIFAYSPGAKGVDAVTSATSKYFASKGLLYTYRDGKRVDSTHLHIREWLDAIRFGTKTSCNIDQAWQEVVSAHMATIAFREGRRVEWDHGKNDLVDSEALKLGNLETV